MKSPLFRFLFLVFIGSFAITYITFPAGFHEKLSSPDGNIYCHLITENDQLLLSVEMGGITVIEKSPLLVSVDGNNITSGIKPGKITRSSFNETYQWYGLHSVAINKYSSQVINLKERQNITDYSLEIRVFNDAVAFRFVIPGEENIIRYPDESSSFKLPAKSLVWYHDLYMHYEGVHAKKMIDTIPEGQWAAPPLTFKLPGSSGYASITEANLTNYAGMALQSDGTNGFTVRLGHSHPASYPYVLRYSKEDVERLSKIAGIKGNITTPWRVIMVGKELNALVNTDVLHNLCSDPDKSLFPD